MPILLLLLFCCLGPLAAVENDDAPVAVVDGEAITVRTLEDELLEREGADLVARLLEEALPRTAWDQLVDADPVIALPSGSITRAELLARLLPKHQEAVMGEMLDSALVERALARHGIALDDTLIQAEVDRAGRKLTARLAARGLPAMDLDTFFRQTKGVGLEDYVRQPGFRWLVAGLHALVREEAAQQVGEAELRARYAKDPERFRVPEGCDCSVIFLPYETVKDADGREVVPPGERARRADVMRTIEKQIADKQMTFATAFQLFARSYEPDADAGGRIGWVRRDGRRERGGRALSPLVVGAIFAVKGPYPFLLPPIAHDAGVELVLVHGWRPETPPDFAAARRRLLEELVDGELDARKQALLVRLRDEGKPERMEDGGVRAAGGIALPLRRVQDEILQREGARAAIPLANALLARIDWTRVAPDDDVLWAKHWRLPRRGFAVRLLGERGAKAREDLITLALIRRELARTGTVVDNAAVEEEIARLERAYRRSPEAATRDFAAFIRESHGAPLEALRQDPAFRLLAGTGVLVRARTRVADEDLREWFARHADRYREPEAVDLATIFLPFRSARAGAPPTPAERELAVNAARQLHAGLQQPGADFAKAWREFGRTADPFARDGRLGWIARDGRRENAAARRVPEPVMAAAFAAQGPFPLALPPIVHEAGVDIAVVHGRRAARIPGWDEVAATVRRDQLEATWDEHLQALVDGLRRQATIEYRDLAPLVEARKPAAAAGGAGKDGAAPASAE